MRRVYISPYPLPVVGISFLWRRSSSYPSPCCEEKTGQWCPAFVSWRAGNETLGESSSPALTEDPLEARSVRVAFPRLTHSQFGVEWRRRPRRKKAFLKVALRVTLRGVIVVWRRQPNTPSSTVRWCINFEPMSFSWHLVSCANWSRIRVGQCIAHVAWLKRLLFLTLLASRSFWRC